MSRRDHGKKNDFFEKLFVHKHEHHDHHHPKPPKGTNGNDVLVGGERNDRLDGRKGDDQIFGNGGDDRLKGGKDDDVLDGGAGSDRLQGDKGDDRLVYAWQDHLSPSPEFADLGTKDRYDGGKGFDTLELRLTVGESLLPAVQADIAAFEAFIAGGHPHGKHHHHHYDGHWFEFSSFGLKVRGFEDLVVTLVNTAPTAVADAGATDEDTVLMVAGPGVLANDSDPDHLDVISAKPGATASALGAAVVIAADGGYSYDPTGAGALQALAQGEAASDSFSYTIVDLGGLEASASVAVALAGVNDAPVAADDAASTDEDTPVSLDLLANDADVDHGAVLSVVAGTVASASGATVQINADGSASYDPGSLFNHLGAGESATDSFTYALEDEHGAADTATVSVTVSGVNDAPEAVDDSASTDEDTPISGDVLGNDSDPDGDTLTVANAGSFTSALGASVTLNADGTFAYDPTGSSTLQALGAGASASDSFTYTVSDGNGGTDTATASIAVSGLADGPPPGGGGFGADFDEADLASEVPLGQELHYFMRIPEVVGGHVDNWVSLEGFSFGFTQSGSIGGGGGGAGQASFEDARVTLGNSGHVTELTGYAAAGLLLQEVELVAAVLDTKLGKFTSVDSYLLEDVLVSSVQTEGSSGATLHEVSFDYGRIERAHSDPPGPEGENASFAFDLQLNVGSQGSAGAIAAPPATDVVQTSVAGQFDYYVRFDGIGDWLSVEGFSFGLTNSTSASSGGGGGAGKASFEDVVLALGSSAELVRLNHALIDGEHIADAQIEVYAQGAKGAPTLIDEYLFTDVLVSGLQAELPNANALSFDYGTFQHKHYVAGAAGGGGVEFGWDVQANDVL